MQKYLRPSSPLCVLSGACPGLRAEPQPAGLSADADTFWLGPPLLRGLRRLREVQLVNLDVVVDLTLRGWIYFRDPFAECLCIPVRPLNLTLARRKLILVGQ